MHRLSCTALLPVISALALVGCAGDDAATTDDSATGSTAGTTAGTTNGSTVGTTATATTAGTGSM
ncbi:MAG: hypothetical protein R3B09_34880, partial [Nannocystaceae bacterium]